MAETDSQSVDAYVAALAPSTRAVFERVIALLRRALPNAHERIAYRIPAFYLGTKPLLYAAAWKKHYALYPIGERTAHALARELDGFEVRGSTLRLPYTERVPEGLIEAIATYLRREASS